ncbi:interleukin 12Ba precursor [Menidia menidia]
MKGVPFNLGVIGKMKLFVFITICAFPHVITENPQSHRTLLPNVLVLDVDGTLSQHPLSCLEFPDELLRGPAENQDIVWKINEVEQVQRGNVHSIRLLESKGGGNYTCHSKDGSLLNYTEVLIRLVDTKRRRILLKTEQDYLKCSAQSYSGEFHCSWTWHSSRAVKVAFVKVHRASDENKTQCSTDASGRQWKCSSAESNFSCSLVDDGQSISCWDERHCPYAEEIQQIYITVHMRTKHYLLESYSKLFFLSEIVKPDKVRIGKVNKTVVQWSYPSSWNRPYSYFPLTFQVTQLKSQCKKCGNPCSDSNPSMTLTNDVTDICQFRVKSKAKAVCVRAKDAFCNSQWSEWSHLKLRRN